MSALPEMDIEIGLTGRVVTAAAASTDLWLRTALATVVTATALPTVANGVMKSGREHLPFYAELARQADATSTFVAPDHVPEVLSTRQLPMAAGRVRGRVELLEYPSRFTPRNPAMVGEYPTGGPNDTCWAQYWRHKDGPRPTLLVCHGFGGSPYIFNSAFFHLPWLYSHGYDVVLLQLPFHGRRREPGEVYSGAGLFSRGIAHLNEAMLQAAHDIRSLINWLEDIGAPRVGMMGLSLGGYTTGMMAAAEPRLHFAIPNCAVVDMGTLIDSWFPMGHIMKAGMRYADLDIEEFQDSVRVHSPLTYQSALPRERLFIVHGLGDRLAPPTQGEALWRHWGRPAIHWFPGNHTLHVNRAKYLRRIGRFLNEIDFAGAEQTAVA